MREKQIRCFSSAADGLKAPPGFMGSAAFSNLRWTLAADQRDEDMRLFSRKLLRRLDGLDMPFYPVVGLMNLATARHRYVTGADPWTPIESPFLEGTAVEFAHAIHGSHLDARQWALFAEIGFDVARLSQVRVAWGGFAAVNRPGLWLALDKDLSLPTGWRIDRRTYGCKRGSLEYAI